MNHNEARLRELLACHGTDVSRWPESAKAWGAQAQLNPALGALIEEERRFERLLRKPPLPSPSQALSQRIIAASLTRPQIPAPAGWLPDLLAEVRPAALAAMLVLGFAVGFGMMTHAYTSDAASLKAYTDDEGTIL